MALKYVKNNKNEDVAWYKNKFHRTLDKSPRKVFRILCLALVGTAVFAAPAAPDKKAKLQAEEAFLKLPDPFKVLAAHTLIRAFYDLPKEKQDAVEKAAKSKDIKDLNEVLAKEAPKLAKIVIDMQKKFGEGYKNHKSENVKKFAAKSIALGNEAIKQVILRNKNFKNVNKGTQTLSKEWKKLTDSEKADFGKQWPEISKLYQQWADHPERHRSISKDSASTAIERLPKRLLTKEHVDVIESFAKLSTEKKVAMAAAVRGQKDLDKAVKVIATVDEGLSKKVAKGIEADRARIAKLDGNSKKLSAQIIDSYNDDLLKVLNNEAAFGNNEVNEKLQKAFVKLTDEEKKQFRGVFKVIYEHFVKASKNSAKADNKKVSKKN